MGRERIRILIKNWNDQRQLTVQEVEGCTFDAGTEYGGETHVATRASRSSGLYGGSKLRRRVRDLPIPCIDGGRHEGIRNLPPIRPPRN